MYHIQDRDDYKKYNKLCGLVTKSVNIIKRLDAEDPVRIDLTDQLLDKYDSLSCHLLVTRHHKIQQCFWYHSLPQHELSCSVR